MKQKIFRSQIGKNITVVSDYMPDVSSVTLGFWLDRGSRDETVKEMGLSHFYEHMIFKGTKTRNPEAIARTLEKSGGSLNAFTGKEQVCIHARFVDEELEAACDIIKDVFHNSLFDGSELEKERNVILEEIRGSEDNPEEFVHDTIMECLWPECSLGWPITGRVHHVSGFDKKDILRMHNRMTKSRIVIAASGNVNHKALCRMMKPVAILTGMETHKRKAAFLSRPQRKSYVKGTQQANIAVAFRIPEFTSIDKYPLLVLNAVLGDGMSSRLFQNIRERLGLAYSIFSFMEANSDSGVIGFFMGTEPASAGKALDALFAELNSVRKIGISQNELDFAKTYLRGNVLLGLESTGNRMGQLARSELYWSRIERIETTLKHIDKVTLNDVKSVADRYFSDKNMALCLAAPKIKGVNELINRQRFC